MGEKPIVETKTDIMDEIAEAFKEGKQMKEGKKPKKTLRSLIDGK